MRCNISRWSVVGRCKEATVALIEINTVFKVYRMGAVEVQALRGVSLTIAEGEMVGDHGAVGQRQGAR